jgi:hypothetical protein
MRQALWLVLAAGCSQIFGIDPPRLQDGGGSPGDASDAMVGDAPACYGTTGYLLCYQHPPTGTVPLMGTMDTTAGASMCSAVPASWTAGGQMDACVIAADTITIGSNLRVTGARPLVLVAATSITIAGTLDLSNHGAGSGSVKCSSMDGANGMTSPVIPGGAGAGGSLETPGGNGGASSSASGSTCGAQLNHLPLRGGMDGGTGGSCQAGTASGGHGGGAVFLAAGTSITVDGVINVSGGGGAGGTYYAGGAGGGSGGMIALYAPSISANGTLMANGGGGGTSGVNNAGTRSGGDPSVTTPTMGGAGGVFGSQASGGDGCGHSPGCPGSPAAAVVAVVAGSCCRTSI